MKDAIEAMKTAFGAYSSGKSTVPLRAKVETEKGVTLLMPAFLAEGNALAVKLVSIYDDNPASGFPRISALVVALDPETGRPVALMDGESLTALRTGAAGGLAADLLSRKNSKVLALFGAGVQGRTQLEAALAVRELETVILYDPNHDACKKLIAGTKRPDLKMYMAKSPREAVESADIVVTATPSKAPVFNGRDLKPGTHVTAIGAFTPEMREIDDATLEKARIFVDSREACLAESGELIQSQAKIDAEIGDVVNGDKPGRQNESEITFFKSVGIATQDAAAASAVLRHAISGGLGKAFDLKK
jgi:ornithine cyclodeaminase/alanine dehydrogenase-like protein (mu-crystallin family)